MLVQVSTEQAEVITALQLMPRTGLEESFLKRPHTHTHTHTHTDTDTQTLTHTNADPHTNTHSSNRQA